MPAGRVAIVGLGLMGGSLAKRLREIDPGVELTGIDPDPVTGVRALGEGVIDRYAPPGEGAAAGTEIVVLAAPLGVALEFLGAEGAGLGVDTLITDLTSLNAPILSRGQRAGIEGRLVTAHPMCGSAESGYGAADSALYSGAVVWLSAGAAVGDEVRERIEAFWTGVGGHPRWIEAEEHDRQMAWVSHLPQLVANALAGALDAAGFEPGDLGPGGRDMTRLAGSSPEIWRDLLAWSAPVAGTGLTSVSRALNVVADLLARRDLDKLAEFMAVTREWTALGDAEGEDDAAGRDGGGRQAGADGEDPPGRKGAVS